MSNNSYNKKVGKLDITVDTTLCIGAGTCIAIAPKAFALDNEAKAIILDSAVESNQDELIDAAKACPVMAIIIKDENGKQIYP